MEASRAGRPQQPPSSSSTRTASNSEVEKVCELSEEARLYISQGLTCDEQGQSEQAKILYEKAIRTIKAALAINVSPSHPQYLAAEGKKEKMRLSQQQMQDRLNSLIANDPHVARAMNDPPPSYEAATTPTQIQDDYDLAMSLSMSSDSLTDVDGARRASLTANATEIFKIENGVQIFFISPEGYVSAPSYPSDLRILKFTNRAAQAGTSQVETPPAFLKVGDWTYPLIPGSSPALHADWGAYVFPDTSVDVQGAAVGVIIPDTVSANTKEAFEQTLKDLTAMRIQPQGTSGIRESATRQPPPRPAPPRVAGVEPQQEPEDERTSTKISKGLVTAAEWISWGLEKGVEQTDKLLKKSSAKAQESLEPNAEKSKVDPRVQQGAHYLRVGAGGAVKVSKYVVEKLGQATMHLAREAAPHVKKHGEKIIPQALMAKQGEGGRSKLEDVAEVAAGGLQGFGTVYTALESAAMALGSSIANETVGVVHHKYGDEAGKLTENALYAAGGIGVTVYNANHLGIKAIAKRTAKDTGRALVEDYSGTKTDATGAGSGKRGAAEVSRDAEEDWVVTDERMDVDTRGRVLPRGSGEKR